MAERLLLTDVVDKLNDLTWNVVKCTVVRLNHMSWNDLEGIENSSNDRNERVMRAIHKWLERDVNASWAQLVSALLKEGQNTAAERIHTRYPNVRADTQPSIETSPDDMVSLQSELTSTQPRVNAVDAPLPSMPQLQRITHFNSSNQTSNSSRSFPAPPLNSVEQQSSTESPLSVALPAQAIQPHGSVQSFDGIVAISESRVQQVEEEISHLDERYADLRSSTHLHMVERESESSTFLRMFRITILEIPQREQAQYPCLFENSHQIHTARNVSMIFDIIRPYTNYMNYELLQWIIKKFGNTPLKEEMRGYIVELETFEVKTTIMEFTSATTHSTEIPECYKSVTIKMNEDPLRCTLHKIREFIKKELARKSFLHPHAIMVQQLAISSVVVKLGIPSSSLAHLSLAFDREFQKAHSILTVNLEGKRLEV